MTLGDVGQLERVLGCEIRERVHLQVRPGGFNGVELWRVGWKKFHKEIAGSADHAGYRKASMDVEPIPHQDDWALDLAPKISYELRQPLAVDVAIGPHREMERDTTALWRHRQCADDRRLFSVASGLRKDRHLPTRRPGSAHERREQEPALIEEDDVRVQSLRFFLMRGQSTLTQRRIAVSSRSRAWRSGFCGVQPNDRSRRPR